MMIATAQQTSKAMRSPLYSVVMMRGELAVYRTGGNGDASNGEARATDASPVAVITAPDAAAHVMQNFYRARLVGHGDAYMAGVVDGVRITERAAAALQALNVSLTERVAAQSELLSRRAERVGV